MRILQIQHAVIVYGGYVSAYDDMGHPWLGEELRCLEASLRAELRVLGICLWGFL